MPTSCSSRYGSTLEYSDRSAITHSLLFGDDDCTCFVTRFTGTFTGPLELPDGTVIQPTGKSFDVFFSTTARWHMGKIVEEYLFYDSATFMKQIGLG